MIRYTHTIFRVADVVIHLFKLFRGEISAIVSLALSLFELYEDLRRWLEKKAGDAGEQTLGAIVYEAA